MLKKLVINLSDYEIKETINQGTFGIVYKIANKIDSKIYAAKESLNIITEESSEVKYLIREVQHLAQINHPLIVKYFGFNQKNFQGHEKPIIVTEYIPNNSLEHYINLSMKGLTPPEFDDTQKIIILYGIALTMKFLHEHGILHRDLKPANILLDKSLYPKICDFGLSKNECSTEKTKQVGTPLYMSPEIIRNNDYTEAGDVYAFGMIAYELLANEIPFKDTVNVFHLFNKILNGERPIIDGTVSTSFKTLIESCWAQDPKKRPTFNDIVDQLDKDDKFITELIDENKYHDFIDEINAIKAFIDPMPDIEERDFNKLTPNEMYEYAILKEKEHDYKEARRCYKLAASTPSKLTCKSHELEKSKNSMMNYAIMCKKGIGGKVDIQEYIEYTKMAAGYNFSRAQYEYGKILEEGQLVEKNLDLAAFYFRAAAEGFGSREKHKYIDYLSKGIGVRKNIFKALQFCNEIKSKKVYFNILNHINDIDETNKDDEIYQRDNINMINGIITFKGKKYRNDFNRVCSGSKSLEEELIQLINNKTDNFPQGFNNCKNLLIQQKNINGTIIVCNSNSQGRNTTFYYELPFDESRILFNRSDIQIEIDIIKARGKNDIYPQGFKNILNLLHNEECIRVFSRKKSPSRNVLFYFKANYIKKYQVDDVEKNWEKVILFSGVDEINLAIEDLKKRKDSGCIFPLGYDQCKAILEEQRAKSEDAIVILNICKKPEKYVEQIFDTKILFEQFCEEEYILKGEKELRKEINKIKHIKEICDKYEYHALRLLQDGKIDLIQLIEDQIANHGKIRVLIRKTNFDYFILFYFKA